MRDDPAVVDLVLRARGGDSQAWDAIVERYAALIWSVCRRFGLTGSDADDVAGSVWLRLVEHLYTLREPAALPGWLARTAQRECLQSLRVRKREVAVDDPEPDGTGPRAEATGDPATDLVAAEQRHALRTAYAELPARCRELLGLLLPNPRWRTRRSVRLSAFRWVPSVPTVDAAWTDCATAGRWPSSRPRGKARCPVRKEGTA